MTAWLAASIWLAAAFGLIVVAVPGATFGVLFWLFRRSDPPDQEQ
jgi:hypothetical protein